MKLAETTLIHTFCSPVLKGSPQFIHVYEDEDIRTSEFSKYKVSDEFDHSFVTIKKNHLRVSWKNKAGPISFCGSGAYGLSWLVLKELKLENIIIEAGKLRLEAVKFENKPLLDIPAHLPQFVRSLGGCNIYCHKGTGIYFIQLNEVEVLEKAKLEEYTSHFGDNEIHGLCLFFWCEETSNGYLRYFTPWHGREEDYVTGSIHQYLTSLIYELFGKSDQIWQQLSSTGGILKTKFYSNRVFLSGDCLKEEIE